MNAGQFTSRLEPAPAIAAFIADDNAEVVVEAAIEGQTVLLAFEPDVAEHARRRDASLGAVRSRGLLHALWTLPEELTWPIAGVDRLDLDTLESEGEGFVARGAGTLKRLYRPAGRVQAIGLTGGRLLDAVVRASLFPSILRRYAIVDRTARDDSDAVTTASACGVGAAISARDNLRILAPAAPSVTGIPGVYRWWLSEVAYSTWVQTSAH